MLLTQQETHMHNFALLCKNETYRKVVRDFSICLIEYFQNGVDFLKNGADFLEKVNAILGKGCGRGRLVAPVAFSVALLIAENAPVSCFVSVALNVR